MEEADLVNQRCLDLKIELLEHRRVHIHHIVDSFVYSIMSLAKESTGNEDRKVQFYDLLQAIDRAVELLDVKCREISEFDKKFLKSLKENATEEFDLDVQFNQTSEVKINEHTILSSKMMKLYEKQEKRLDENEEQVEMMNTRLNDIEKVATEIKNMKKQLKKLSENQNHLQDRIISRMSDIMDTRLLDLRNETVFLKDIVMSSGDKCKSIMDNVLIRTDSLENITADLSEQICKDKESLGTVSTKQEQYAIEIEEITKKLVAVEERDGKFEDQQKQFEEINENYRIVCQMLATRLKPLECLRQALNEKCLTKDENVAKLQDLAKEIAIMSPRIDRLEIRNSRIVVGFTAGILNIQKIPVFSAIRSYGKVYCNIGGHFDQISGVFEVPFDGTYVVSIIMMCDDHDSQFEVHVICDDVLVSNRTRRTACWATSGPNATRYSDLSVIEMKSGNILFAEVVDKGLNMCSNKALRISCFLIGCRE